MSLMVLMYHEIGGPNRYDVSPETFRRQMRHIRECGYAVLRPELLARTVGDAGRQPAVMVTFDDGYASDFAAARIMASLGLAGVSFVTTGFVGRPGYLSWPQVREMAAGGFSIQSHSHTHPLLAVMPEEVVRRECAVSKVLLEQHTGRPVTSLSLPGGSGSRLVFRTARAAGYRYIFSSRPGINDAVDVPGGEIRRITVTGNMPFDVWRRLLEGDPALHRAAAMSYGIRKIVKAVVGPARYQRAWRALAK